MEMKLQTQRDDLNHLRNQASISAAITGLVATVFATLLRIDDVGSGFYGDFFLGFSAPGVLLLSVFAAAISLCTLVVVGRKEFTFSFKGDVMLEKADHAESPAEFYRRYTLDAEWFFLDNEKKINRTQMTLWWAMVLGWVQIIPWIMMV